VHHGTQKELWAECGFDKAAIVAKAKEMLDYSEVKESKEKVG
jgi:hypothetical protein